MTSRMTSSPDNGPVTHSDDPRAVDRDGIAEMVSPICYMRSNHESL